MFDEKDYDDAVPTALDLMEGFSKPPDTEDQDAYAERTQFVWHTWPGAFNTAQAGIGHASLQADVVYPLFARTYRTRHLGDGGTSLDVEIPKDGFSARFRPGYAVSCLSETYQSLGLVALTAFTRAETHWDLVRAWYRRVVDVVGKLPSFDWLEEKRRRLVAAKKQFTDPVELAALEQMIGGVKATRVALRAWAAKRITEATKAQASGVGRIAPSDTEINWMLAAGVRIPKFMADYSEREDLPTTDEKPVVEESSSDATAERSLALMQQMADAFMQMATQPRDAEKDTRIADLEDRLGRAEGALTKATELLTQIAEAQAAAAGQTPSSTSAETTPNAGQPVTGNTRKNQPNGQGQPKP